MAARRERPQDDLISILVEAELTDEAGVRHRLSDPEIYSFALLLLAAGSGTTWKQMGITLTALLRRPDFVAAIRQDRQLLRDAVEESLRWSPTDPMFSRWVTRDIDFHGLHMRKGEIVWLGLASANHDPKKFADPRSFDIDRADLNHHLAFGAGPHRCMGMHLARHELVVLGARPPRVLRRQPEAWRRSRRRRPAGSPSASTPTSPSPWATPWTR